MIRKLKDHEVARFWARTVATESGCLIWQGSGWFGYGAFAIDRVNHRAHRVAYMIKNGPYDWDKYVCHSCDNKGCVNPEHLFLGTTEDNMADMVAKGRQHKPVGSKNSCAKLSEGDVVEIRSNWCAKQKYLAERYGVCQSAISSILSGRSWSHVAV